jgi:hypothetical protein
MKHIINYPAPLPLWQRILFRFFSVYLLLHVFAKPFFEDVPVFSTIAIAQHYICFVSVNFFNTYVLHFADKLAPIPLSTDALFNYAQLLLFLSVAAVGTVVWSLTDSGRKPDNSCFYVVTVVRYFLAYVSFMYGIIKLYGLQMPFPTLTEMATPFGDFTPMKLLWHTTGYSAGYQKFSGLMEFMVGVLLMYRRTVTLGVLLALGVYINVFLLNLSYDIPIKIFSFHLVLMCLFLLIMDSKRLFNFFIFNKPAAQSVVYSLCPSKLIKFRPVAKIIFVLSVMYLIAGPFNAQKRQQETAIKEIKPIPHGLYNVITFVKNGDTLPVLAKDTLIWKDIIFERGNKYATVNSADTLFKPLYNRGFFYYKADTLANTMTGYKYTESRKQVIFNLKYKLSDNKEQVKMWIALKKDSLYIELNKNEKQFKLSQKQFHWITED